MININQIESFVYRFPIDENNFPIYQELLKLPYKIYKPIVDLLCEGKITIEDLMLNDSELIKTNNKVGNEKSLIEKENTMTESELKNYILKYILNNQEPDKLRLDYEPVSNIDANGNRVGYSPSIDKIITGWYKNLPDNLSKDEKKEEQQKQDALIDKDFKKVSV